MYSHPNQLGVTEELFMKSIANNGNKRRLQKVLIKALEGDALDLVILGGSISRGAPFSERGLDFRIYFHAIVNWWNRVFSQISGSKLEAKSISIGGIGTDYYSYCLTPHLPEDTRPTIFLWELAANDRGRYDDKQFPRAYPLEQLTRNILLRPSNPLLMFANFFRGNDYLQKKCLNFEDEGGQKIAEIYHLTSISWRDFVCDNLNAGQEGFRMKDLFADDNLHPSLKGHAQMAYLLINYLRLEFLNVLKNTARMSSLSEFKDEMWSRGDMSIPGIIYHETSAKSPQCKTYFYNDGKEPNNTLPVEIIDKSDFHYNIYKKFKLRGDQLGGLQTKFSEQLLQFAVTIDRPICRLVIVSHSGTGTAKCWIDAHASVDVDTMKYSMGTKMDIIATNLRPGKYHLNILSMKGGFAISGIAII
uniref:SGNH/GDSL hydrolase family protein n=2 Tax=Clytia hemisphaerica TaxID=252671 RepID=A0A7M5XHC0_9CNID|eukprot:TCONS_00011711-protein